MGQNSTEVAYQFGQFGSAITDSTSARLLPPPGLRIVAITALEAATFDAAGGLVSELNTDNQGGISVANYITTESAAHGAGEISDTDPHNGGNATGTGGVTGVVTTNADMLAAGVKPGMFVHTDAGTMLPYSATDPFIVKTVTDTTFTVTKGRVTNAAVVTAATKADGSNEACYFYSNHGQGVGGLEMDASDSIPAGCTIYGRWTELDLAGGRVIAYFGK